MYIVASMIIGALVSAALVRVLSRKAEEDAQFFIARDGAPRSANGKAFHAWSSWKLRFDIIACITIVNASNIYLSGGKAPIIFSATAMTITQIAVLMIGMAISVHRYTIRHQPLVDERYMSSVY